MNADRIVVERERFDEEAAAWLALRINGAVEARGRCSVALAGGSTPRPVYWTLAQEPFRSTVRWDHVWVYFGDERAVPPEHPDNNYGAVNEALLKHIPVPASQVFRMEAERSDRESAAAAYARLLPGRLDILMLGMGSDGHTASLFPGSPALEEQDRRVMAVIGPKPPAERLTITPPVISAARDVLVLVTGGDKTLTVAMALEGPLVPRSLPIQLARDGTWMLDRAAAGGLA